MIGNSQSTWIKAQVKSRKRVRVGTTPLGVKGDTPKGVFLYGLEAGPGYLGS